MGMSWVSLVLPIVYIVVSRLWLGRALEFRIPSLEEKGHGMDVQFIWPWVKTDLRYLFGDGANRPIGVFLRDFSGVHQGTRWYQGFDP